MFKNARKIEFKKCFFLACAVLLLAGNCFAQEEPDEEKDTLDIYKEIKRFAYKRKATKFLYHAVFVDPAPATYEKKPLSDEQAVKDPRTKYQDRIIRKIIIEVNDPFGYSVNDTSRKGMLALQKAGNRLHINTRKRVIRNTLLFKLQDPADIVAIVESERLLRTLGYLSDARIYLLGTGSNDSVDVKVVVQDKWKLNAPFLLTPASGNLTIRNRNILGFGQSYEQNFGYRLSNQSYEVSGLYQIANIDHSYISSNIFYSLTDSRKQAGLSFDRPFYSALAKWAGGVSGNRTWTYFDHVDTTSATIEKYKVNSWNCDTWLAKSFKIGFGKTKNRRFRNIVIAGRYAGTKFQDRPPLHIDTNRLFAARSLYIGSVGFSLSKYYKDQFIYRFGANEDIPEGLVIQALYGLAAKENEPYRFYSGFEISRGKHFRNFGYISPYFSFGTFYNKGISNNATWNTGFVYFTDLFEGRQWYFRQFVYYKLVSGLNKLPEERITLNAFEMYGLNIGDKTGTAKMVLNFETVMYTPYNLFGFRFAPVLLMGYGMLKSEPQKFISTKIYHGYAAGLLIRNENLLVSSFQFTIGIYPENKGIRNIFKFNPVSTFTLNVRNFAFSRPRVIPFE
jgi:hypothetical protein